VCRVSENHFTELRIPRAYFKLMCCPEGSARMVSLGGIGNCEIRMYIALRTNAGKEPLFVIDLFDHDAQLSIDSRFCYDNRRGCSRVREFRVTIRDWAFQHPKKAQTPRRRAANRAGGSLGNRIACTVSSTCCLRSATAFDAKLLRSRKDCCNQLRRRLHVARKMAGPTH